MLDVSTLFYITIAILLAITLLKGIQIVPQQEAWIIESLGKYDRVLQPGLSFLIPFIQRVAYKHTLKEQAIDVHRQTAITKDNVTLNIDGVLYLRITDAVHASYGVSDPYYAVIQLAQTTMRSEIGKMTLDKTFEEREVLNINIVTAINQASNAWGLQCMRYEIKDIEPPQTVLQAMELQVAADRQKRAEILSSEGKRQSQINVAEGAKCQVVLSSEAAMTDQINRAKGEAEAILAVADATAKGISKIGAALMTNGGTEAASLRIAQDYIKAFEQLAKESTTLLLPAAVNDPASMVSQALSVFETIKKTPQASSLQSRLSKNEPYDQ
jgi:regulator of protease activity HflC (stomatin/prohibitin superfamily)